MKIRQHHPKAGHTYSKNLNALLLKKFSSRVSFYFAKKLAKKIFSPMTKKILQHQPKGKPHTQ
jgi:hypothetical protein